MATGTHKAAAGPYQFLWQDIQVVPENTFLRNEPLGIRENETGLVPKDSASASQYVQLHAGSEIRMVANVRPPICRCEMVCVRENDYCFRAVIQQDSRSV